MELLGSLFLAIFVLVATVMFLVAAYDAVPALTKTAITLLVLVLWPLGGVVLGAIFLWCGVMKIAENA